MLYWMKLLSLICAKAKQQEEEENFDKVSVEALNDDDSMWKIVI